MENRIPLTIHSEETISLAVQLRAAKDGVSISDVVNAILREALTAEIAAVSGVPTLAAVLQNFLDRRQFQPGKGTQRRVPTPGKLSR